MEAWKTLYSCSDACAVGVGWWVWGRLQSGGNQYAFSVTVHAKLQQPSIYWRSAVMLLSALQMSDVIPRQSERANLALMCFGPWLQQAAATAFTEAAAAVIACSAGGRF